MFPQTPQATVELLERLGCRVEFPEAQSCCGQMFTNTGYFREALDCVRAYVRAFEDYDYVVAPSGSCVAAVREQHPLLAADSGDAGLEQAVRRLAGRSFELSEFIIDVLGTEDVGACFPHSVTFHPTCHALRIAGLGDRPLRLLRHVRGLTLLSLPDWEQCCGFGGTFSLKNPDVSASMAAAKAEAVEATGAEFLVTVDNACLMNIGGVLSRSGSRVRTIHLAEVLASI
jgi:L-lactate dehydrogenase complex protein LldE